MLAVLALVLGAGSAVAQGSRELGAALELERVGRTQDAADAFVRVLATDPTNLQAIFGLERTLSALGQLERLVPYVDSLLDRRPGESAVRALQLRTLGMLGRDDALRAAAEAWIAAAPDSPEPYREWAYAQAQRGDLAGARRALERGLVRVDDQALLADLAQVAVVAGDWAEAARRWHAAVLRAPTLAAAAGLSLTQAPPAERDRVTRLLTADIGDAVARRLAADALVGWGRALDAWLLLDASLPDDPRAAADALRRFAERAALVATPEGARARGYAFERLAERERGAAVQRWRIEAARAFADAGLRSGAERMLDQIARDTSAAPAAAGDAMAMLIGVMADADRVAEAERRLADWGARLPEGARDALRQRIAWAWARRGDVDRAERLVGGDSTVQSAALRGWIALLRGDVRQAAEQFGLAGPYVGSRTEATLRTSVVALLERLGPASVPELGAAFGALVRGDSAAALERLERTAHGLRPTEGRADVLEFAGRVAAASGDARAEDFFARAVASDSTGPAAPAAALGLAELALRAGRPAQAIVRLERLILAYPESAVLPQARRLLDRARGAVPNS